MCVRHARAHERALPGVWATMTRRTRLARHIPRLALLLIAGVVTTAAIAYAGTVLYPPLKATQEHDGDGTWSRDRTPFRSVYSVTISRETAVFSNRSARQLLREAYSESYKRGWLIKSAPGVDWTTPQNWRIYEAGWPWRATWGWACTQMEDKRYVTRRRGHVEIRTPHTTWSLRPNTVELPYLPLWRGLILSTLFYAAIWWGLLALPRLIRRTLRARRGLCPSCAYDMRGLTNSPCPECGRNGVVDSENSSRHLATPAGAKP